MNQLEKDLEGIIKLITQAYWPSRSGRQDGFDSFSKFYFGDREYIWKFESKDLNAKRHKANFSGLEELESADFTDKIMQIMARRDRYLFPHVFCVFVPHKVIGTNNTLREDIKSWNVYNKFPFKILVWDFELLSSIIPHINSPHADSIYPNAPQKNKSLSKKCVGLLKDKIEKESIDGFFHNRSYIKERDAKDSVTIPNAMQIKIEKIVNKYPKLPGVKFAYKEKVFNCDYGLLAKYGVSVYPTIQTVVIRKSSSLTSDIQGESSDSVKSTLTFDVEKYNEKIDKARNGLLQVFKELKYRNQNLYDLIKNFCASFETGVVTFLAPKDIAIASTPLKELSSEDFEEKSKIHFYFEFANDE